MGAPGGAVKTVDPDKGVMRKLKRGRRLQSVIQDDIGKVVFEGGIFLTDCEIEDCNRLLICMDEVDAEQVWKMGHKMSMISEVNRAEDLQKLKAWDTRDARGMVNGSVEGFKENLHVVNADN